MKNFFLNTLKSILRIFAKKIISSSKVDIIGITGSVGKSSSKEAIYQVLSQSFKEKVKKSEGNLNNELGLPLAVLGVKNSPRFYLWPFVLISVFFKSYIPSLNPLKKTSILVLEYASDKPGDLYYLSSFARPKISVVTLVAEAHLEFFHSIDQIAQEKANLVRVLPPEGMAILNSDNDYAWRMGLSSKNKVIYYGMGDKAQIRAKNIKITLNGTNFDLLYQDKVNKVHLQAIGEAQVYAALSAVAVGLAYKLKLEDIIKSLSSYQAPAARDQIVSGINKSFIIDSTYNANLTSMKSALKTLQMLDSKGRKIAVLGDMLEIGDISDKAHVQIAQLAQKISDKVILVGPEFKKVKSDKWFLKSQEAANFLVDKIKENDIILIKGSHAMEMEKITDILKARQNGNV